MSEYIINIGRALILTVAYFGVMIFYTFLNVMVLRKIACEFSNVLNLITVATCICLFVLFLKRTGYKIQLFSNINFTGIILALGCVLLFFLLLDKCLDSVFESLFPQSEQDYQKAVQTLMKSPVTSLVQICLLAPFIEEILMRGVVLGGLKVGYGTARALLVSSSLFASLHFNILQTLSAFCVRCCLVLGLLYIKTNSTFCCILAHCGYNLISYLLMLFPI